MFDERPAGPDYEPAMASLDSIRAVVLVVLACTCAPSCGDNEAAGDAMRGIDAAAARCTATFSGNFSETSSGGSDCPMVATDPASGDVTLAFDVPSTTLAAPLAIAFDLGATPAPGVYSPEIVSDWTALVTSSVDSSCVYSAGSDAVPNGSFTLTLVSIDAGARTAHGSLMLDEYLHAFVLTDCGPVPTEDVELVF